MNRILKTARIARGISTRALAKALGITPLQYLELERCQQPLEPAYAAELARIYRLPIHYFRHQQPADLRERIALLQEQLKTLRAYTRGNTSEQLLAKGTVPALLYLQLHQELAEIVKHDLELNEELVAQNEAYKELYHAYEKMARRAQRSMKA